MSISDADWANFNMKLDRQHEEHMLRLDKLIALLEAQNAAVEDIANTPAPTMPSDAELQALMKRTADTWLEEKAKADWEANQLKSSKPV